MSNEITKAISDNELIGHLENLGLLKNITPGEKNTFIQIAKAFNLNPFKREIYISKYGDQPASIITGYEVYIKRAERSGTLDGWAVKTEGKVSDGSLKAIITIHRKDRSHPFVWEVLYSEYVQLTKDGNVTKFWKKAETMIKKVAMAQGFRLCFSDELGGMPYTGDETGVEETQDTPAHVTTAAAPSGNAPVVSEAKPPKVLSDLSLKKALKSIETGDLKTWPSVAGSYSVTEEQLAKLNEAAFTNALPRVKAGEDGVLDAIRLWPLTDEQKSEIEGSGMPF